MQQLWLIPLFPLLGFVLCGLLGNRLGKPFVNAAAIGSVLLSFFWVLKVLSTLGIFMPGEATSAAHLEQYFTWIESGSLQIGFDFAVDRLSAVMLLVVTGVGLLIHVYAIGYMSHEEGYHRFFSYLNLFMFFMLTLVLAANYLLMFVGWEGVGLCSYLLIGFYFKEKFATDAGNKAFMVNRIGDFGYTLGIFLIAVSFGSLDFGKVLGEAAGRPTETSAGVLTAICLLLLLGAAGKSAQIPLYVWLPDAMAGPTPVSALIHAATMVTAGVYMIARSSALFVHAPIAMDVVAWIGLATAVVAATIGLVQNDIKKVFAYSTVSQLGYMFVALGTGAFAAGIFHVVTHAFFKALLFLGAGSVIHALHGEQDLTRMGGLRSKLPVTFLALLAAAVAIAGVPPFSGFHSKDAILLAAHHRAPWMYWVGVITAGMTAFYVFRAIFLAFFGSYRGDRHPHESPAVMTVPLAILALLSLGGGYLPVMRFLEPSFPKVTEEHDPTLVVVSVAAGLAGIAIAWFLYVLRPSTAGSLQRAFSAPYQLLYNKYFVDEVYNAAIVEPTLQGSRSVLWKGIDQGLVDGLVRGVAASARGLGGMFRRLQSGYIRNYAAWVVLGSLIVLLAIGLAGGGR